MLTVELIGDTALIARLKAMPNAINDGLARTITRLGLELQRKVKSEKLSGQVLKVRTGVLRESINLRVDRTSTAITASVGTNVKYGRFQEFGVDHSWQILPKSARVLAFEIGGKTIFARSVTHPPLPERSFLRSALREMTPRIEAEMRAAVGEAVHA